MTDNMDNAEFTAGVWTEVECTEECYNQFVQEPIFDEDHAQFFLCREDGTRKPVRMSTVVFRQYGSEDWEDDIMYGCVEAQALGDGQEEPIPVKIYNLGTPADELVKVIKQDANGTLFTVNYDDGNIEVPAAQKTDEGFLITHEQVVIGDPIEITFNPTNGKAFTMHIEVPNIGLTIRDGEGKAVTGNLELSFEDVMTYTYSFKGNENDDRFLISFNNDKKIYLYIQSDSHTLSIRNKKDKMAKVGETASEGKLALLLEGIPNAVIKHGNERWRIKVEG